MPVRDVKDRQRRRELLEIINRQAYDIEKIKELERDLLQIETEKNVLIDPPFRIDYGTNIHFEGEFYANMDCLFLDTGDIYFGNKVKLGPRVQIYTVNHPVDPVERIEKHYSVTAPVIIKENVWIGGGVIINPGVTIGENTVVGSGSVVTESLPSNVLAAGVPARVIRKLG